MNPGTKDGAETFSACKKTKDHFSQDLGFAGRIQGRILEAVRPGCGWVHSSVR